MDLTIESTLPQQELQRKEIRAHCTFDNASTPSRADLQAELSKQVKVPAEQIIVKNIATGFGNNNANIVAFAYDSLDAAKNAEPSYMLKKNEIKVAKEEKAEGEA